MQVAQRLFQGIDIGGGDLEGLISYHRTDSTTLSDKALGEAGRRCREMYGDDYYKGPRQYQTKVRNAQEAHEAIRPTEFRRTPQSLERCSKATSCGFTILIWKRAIASQMADARLLRTTVEITGRTADGDDARVHGQRQGDRVPRLPARLRRGQRRSGGGARRAGNAAAKAGRRRPGARARSAWTPGSSWPEVETKGHETTPPARFTEASLVKRLEEEGIGRPSTYAPTVATIQRRGYVSRQGKALVPSFTAFAVTRLLREHFGDYVDLGFTAEMEEILDQISNGETRLARLHPRVLSRRRQAPRAREPGRRQGPGDRLSGGRRRRRSRQRACRCACALGATARSCSWANRATKVRARRCPTISRRPI